MRILGHRGGAAGRAPENSIPAFLDGLTAGADVLELDVHLSRDGRVVVIHDPVIDRVSTGSGRVAQLGAAELRRIPLLGPNGVPVAGTHVPTLAEVLEAIGPAALNIDLKTDDPNLARELVRVLERGDATDRCTVGSFFPAALRFFRSLAPSIETSAGPDEVKETFLSWLRFEEPTTPGRRFQIPPRHGLIPLTLPRFVRYLHRHHRAMDVWTINNPATARRLVARGVDGIVTDDVATIKTALEDI